MAKSRSRLSSALSETSLTPSTLTQLLEVSTPATVTSPLDDPVILRQLYHGRYEEEDRRTHYPTSRRNRPALGLIRDAVRLVDDAKGIRQQFNIPKAVGICVRRKARKEVLHALGKTKKGSGSGRRHTPYSRIKC